MEKEVNTNDFLYNYDDIIKEILMSKNNIDQEKNSPLMEEFNFKNAQDLLEFEEFPYLIGDIEKENHKENHKENYKENYEENYKKFFIQLFKSLSPINKYIVMLVLRFMEHKFDDNKIDEDEINFYGYNGMSKINKEIFKQKDSEIIKKISDHLSNESKDGNNVPDDEYIGKIYRIFTKNSKNKNISYHSKGFKKICNAYLEISHIPESMCLFASKYWNKKCNDVNWLFESLSSHNKDAIIMLARKLNYFYNNVAVNDKKCPEASLDLTEYILQQNAIFEVLPELIDKDKS